MKDTFEKDNVGEYSFFDAFQLYREALEVHCKNLFDDDVDDLDTSLNYVQLYERMVYWERAILDKLYELKDELDWVTK